MESTGNSCKVLGNKSSWQDRQRGPGSAFSEGSYKLPETGLCELAAQLAKTNISIQRSMGSREQEVRSYSNLCSRGPGCPSSHLRLLGTKITCYLLAYLIASTCGPGSHHIPGLAPLPQGCLEAASGWVLFLPHLWASGSLSPGRDSAQTCSQASPHSSPVWIQDLKWSFFIWGESLCPQRQLHPV